MFNTDLHQQVLALSTPWKVIDVKLNVVATQIHVHVEHPKRGRAAVASGRDWTLLNLRDTAGENFNALLIQFAIARFLYRLSLSPR